MSSGSKKPRGASKGKRAEPPPPELRDWQSVALDCVAQSKLASELVFGGGAALATLDLHHRWSADVDFFLQKREVQAADLRSITSALQRHELHVEQDQVGPRRSLVLSRGGDDVGRVDFAYYPYDPIGRRRRWRGLVVESLIDMTVNKLQALLTRFQPRDYVDIYFLLHEGEERDLERLLQLVRAKFEVGSDRLSLAQRMLLAPDIQELPEMLRPLTRDELVRFFDDQARLLVGRR